MNELKVFESSEFGMLEILLVDGREMFPATECAKILGYANPHKALEDHCRYLTKREVPHPQSQNKMIEKNYITEGDLYRLIARSKLPAAERFESWVFDEVLPTIRKTGGYIVGEEHLNEDQLVERALQVVNEKLRRREAENARLKEKLEAAAPKVEYFDDLVDRGMNTGIRDTAKELGVKQGELTGYLIRHGYLYRDKKGMLKPTAHNKTDGLFKVNEWKARNSSACGVQTLITPKGKQTFKLLVPKMKSESAAT